MQISGSSHLPPRIPQQPQPAVRPPVPGGAPKAATAAGLAAAKPPGSALANPLAAARTLEEAVRTLAAEGHLPPRGSLVDIRA